MVKTRSAPAVDTSADKERVPEPMAATPESVGAQSLSHTSSPDILSIIENDISSLSSEGKTIVSAIIKAMQTISDSKDQRIEQLETKVTVLEKKFSELEKKVDE